MKPSGTIYRLATDEDTPILDALVEKALPWTEKTEFGIPTVVAEKKGKIVGLLARNPNADALLTEPMVAPNGVIYMRLIEAYENALRFCGFTGKNYFRVPHLADDQLKLMQKRPTIFTPSAKDDTYHWFYRRL